MPEKLSCEGSLTNTGTNGGCILPGVPSCHRATGASRGWAAVAMSWLGGGFLATSFPSGSQSWKRRADCGAVGTPSVAFARGGGRWWSLGWLCPSSEPCNLNGGTPQALPRPCTGSPCTPGPAGRCLQSFPLPSTSRRAKPPAQHAYLGWCLLSSTKPNSGFLKICSPSRAADEPPS